MLRAAEGWYGRNAAGPPLESETGEEVTVTVRTRCKARARLLAKVYEIDIFSCPKCGGRMSVIAVIRNTDKINKIIHCLKGQGRGPPYTEITTIMNLAYSGLQASYPAE